MSAMNSNPDLMFKGHPGRPRPLSAGNIRMPPLNSRPESGNQIRGSVDRMFGCFVCNECELIWADMFVPRRCPGCDVKLTDAPGGGFEAHYLLLEQRGFKLNLWVCPRCRLRIEEPHPYKACPRCFHQVIRPWHRRLRSWSRHVVARIIRWLVFS
jgi:hypothetical protein